MSFSTNIETIRPKPTLRSSSLPQFMVCSNAVLNPDNLIRVETENETATLGTLVHAQCESLVSTGSYDMESLKHRLNEEDYERAWMLFNNFLRVWKEAQGHMLHAKTEQQLGTETTLCTLTGNVDCVDMSRPRVAYVLDYKTGRQHEDHYHQMAGYAYLIWSVAGRPGDYTVFVTTVYLEDNSLHPYVFKASDLEAWEKELTKQIQQVRYTAGRKCSFCTLQGSCPAYHAYVSGSIRTFNDDFTVTGQVWEDMTEEQRGDLIDRMYVVEKAIDRIKLSLRNTVKSVGSVPIGKGMEYVLVEQTEKSLDPAKAWPLLMQRIGEQAIRGNVRLPLDDVLTAFAARAARGQKTKARKELFEELDEAGAIVRNKSTKMWRRPVGEKSLDVTPEKDNAANK